jgi:tripeptide aminopeptidase
MERLLDRFLGYVRIDTQSDEDSANHPSTAGQLRLAELLADEMHRLGLTNINFSDQGYLTAEIEANCSHDSPAIGLIAHLDTSPEVSGKAVKPLIFRNYDGQDLMLNPAENLSLRVQDYPELQNYIGQTLVASDGTTLLGADDKAGVAIIMTFLAHIMNKPDLKHGKIVIVFTPDEEIGRGSEYFDVPALGAAWAYTIDGGPLGELEYENFNAAAAHINIIGNNIHPGSAYQRMKNALLIAMELNGLLPVLARPENTRNHEGFYHLNQLGGGVEHSRMTYLIRDHDRVEFEHKKAYLQQCIANLNDKYGSGTIELTIQDQYRNMREKIEPVFHIVQLAERAMSELGIEPIIKPIRGGTDGARLSYQGLPCPNLFTGGHNFHSRHEFICLESMQAAVQVIIRIIELAARNAFQRHSSLL